MKNLRKKLGLGSCAIFGFILLLKFQNCAPGANFDPSSGLAPPPSVIDDVNLTTDVAFVQKALELRNTSLTFEAHGICSEYQEGATMNWFLVDSSSSAMVKNGQVGCAAGGFKVTVDDSQSLDCGHTYMLQAQLGNGEMGEVEVMRLCAPTQSKMIADTTMAKKGIACFYEQRAYSDCEKSCYRLDMVVSKETVDSQACL